MAVESLMQIGLKEDIQASACSTGQKSSNRKLSVLFGEVAEGHSFKSVLSSKKANNSRMPAPKETADNAEEEKTSSTAVCSYYICSYYNEALYDLASQKEAILAGLKEGMQTDGWGIGNLEAVQRTSYTIKYDEVFYRLASILGLNSNEFAHIMENSQISLQELADVKNAHNIARKIADMAELDPNQEQMLATKIIEALSDAANGRFMKAGLSTEGKSGIEIPDAVIEELFNQKPESAEHNDAVIAQGSDIPSDFETVLQKMRISLQEMIYGKEAVTEKDYEAVTSQGGGIYPENKMVNAENGSITGNPDKGMAGRDEELTIAKAGQETNNKDAVDTMHKQVFESLSAMEENGEAVIPDHTLKVYNPVAEKAENRVYSPSLPNGKYEPDILNQVLDKAKIIQLGEKTEIVMHLKPDNLGELSLKITSENGMLTAGFVAENHQVRQVLESNMHILRDALERQGLAVQDFNVAVRQELQQHPNHDEKPYHRPKLVSIGKSTPIRERDIYDRWTLESPLGANLYGLSDSTLDIIA